MNKDKYIIPLFLGTLGFLYNITINVSYNINFFVSLLVSILAALLLGYGYQLIEENYEKNKVGKIKMTLVVLIVLVLIITSVLASYYDPIMNLIVGALLALISLLSVRLIYR